MIRQELSMKFHQSERARGDVMLSALESVVVMRNPANCAIVCRCRLKAMRALGLTGNGVDNLSHRFFGAADTHDLPIAENRPLARAPYAGVDLDDEVPAEHYQTAVEFISFARCLYDRVMSKERRQDD
jgi:flagellar biosynthetic protein FlhB